MTCLKYLAYRIERGRAISPEDAHFAVRDAWHLMMDGIDGNINAAVAFKDAMLPEWRWALYDDGGAWLFLPEKPTSLSPVYTRAANTARALVVATLRALADEREATE